MIAAPPLLEGGLKLTVRVPLPVVTPEITGADGVFTTGAATVGAGVAAGAGVVAGLLVGVGAGAAGGVVSSGLTVMLVATLMSPAVTVMVAEPGLRATTRPFASTIATLGSLDSH